MTDEPATTPAAVLREAAAAIRANDDGGPWSEFRAEIAAWFDTTAAHVGTSSPAYHAALNAARVYLGSNDD